MKESLEINFLRVLVVDEAKKEIIPTTLGELVDWDEKDPGYKYILAIKSQVGTTWPVVQETAEFIFSGVRWTWPIQLVDGWTLGGNSPPNDVDPFEDRRLRPRAVEVIRLGFEAIHLTKIAREAELDLIQGQTDSGTDWSEEDHEVVEWRTSVATAHAAAKAAEEAFRRRCRECFPLFVELREKAGSSFYKEATKEATAA